MAINKFYRSTYTSEEAVTELVYRNSQWVGETTQIKFTETGDPSYGRCAVVFGNGISRKNFNTNLLSNRLLNTIPTKILRTYGCNAIYRDFLPDFLVVTGNDMIDEIASLSIASRTNVFASRHLKRRVIGNQVHNIPQNPPFNAGATAAYLAAFDEHKKVFLLGFDGIDDPASSYNIYEGTPGYPAQIYSEEYWVRSMLEVFTAYSDVDFVRVMPEASYRIPEAWKYASNFRQINYNQFVLEADL